jgi:uncharacterized membrane protein
MDHTQHDSGLFGNAGAYDRGHDGGNEMPMNVGGLERALSVALGAFLVYNGIKRLRKAPLSALSRAAIGTGLLFRGSTGHCPVYNRLEIDGTKTTSVNIRVNFVVNKTKDEVYAFWRKLENLPKFMTHLASVKELDQTRSHWEAKIPENNPVTISWDAEIVKDEPASLLSWRSLPGATIENAGKVEFRDALGNRGTELRVMITYRPPAGSLGSGVAKLVNPLFEKMVREDVMNFKQYIEMRGTPTVGEYA